MKKRVLSMFMAVCMMAAAVTGCGASENQKTELPEKMVFTYVTAPLNVPSVVEKVKGMFMLNSFVKIWEKYFGE